MKHSMTIAILLLIATVSLLLFGAFPLDEDTQPTVFRSLPLLLILGAVALSVTVCCIIQKAYSYRHVFFLLAHVSVIVILVGALLGYLKERKVHLVVPVGDSGSVRQMADGANQNVDFGFDLKIPSFTVEHYPPASYSLYELDPDSEEMYFIQTFPLPQKQGIDDGKLGQIPLASLHDKNQPGGWVKAFRVGEHHVLVLDPPEDKSYSAKLTIVPQNKQKLVHSFTVNHPVSHAGWRFYLMDYDQQEGKYVILSARYDPGRHWVIGGMWALIIGTAGSCLTVPRRQRDSEDDAKSEGNQ